jgi:hypothetical protein
VQNEENLRSSFLTIHTTKDDLQCALPFSRAWG